MIDAALMDRIDREWGDLSHELVAWDAGGRRARDVLDDVAADPDGVLGWLIAQTQAGDALAGRIVCQAMLPKLILMAGRDPRAGLDDYLAQLWLRIGSYPLDRRRERIAANLALDTLKAIRQEYRSLPSPVEQDELERQLPPSPPVEFGEELSARRVLRGAGRLGLLDDFTSRVLLAVYVEGLSSQEAAARFGSTAGSIRWRCSRAVRLLARHADELAVA